MLEEVDMHVNFPTNGATWRIGGKITMTTDAAGGWSEPAGGGGSVEVGDAGPLQPLLADLHLDPGHAHRAPHPLAAGADQVLVVPGQVEVHVLLAAVETEDRGLHRRPSMTRGGRGSAPGSKCEDMDGG